MPVVMKNKVTVTNFKPKTIPFARYKDKPAVVGIIVGRVNNVSERTDTRTGETYNGLVGSFKQIIADDNGNIDTVNGDMIAAGTCYLPDSFQNMVESAFNDGGGRAANAQIDFVYEVSLGRRGEQDYEWVFRDLVPARVADPLAGLMGDVRAALPAPAQEAPGKPAKG